MLGEDASALEYWCLLVVGMLLFILSVTRIVTYLYNGIIWNDFVLWICGIVWGAYFSIDAANMLSLSGILIWVLIFFPIIHILSEWIIRKEKKEKKSDRKMKNLEDIDSKIIEMFKNGSSQSYICSTLKLSDIRVKEVIDRYKKENNSL